ncbi:putative uncharacterized protein BRD3OS [Scomber scombrus]|uniref:Uncharacterized protein n=1 Tax=Scomber scombrus TaxID=13677 RepID=A0AAV1QDC8_SCOSC
MLDSGGAEEEEQAAAEEPVTPAAPPGPAPDPSPAPPLGPGPGPAPSPAPGPGRPPLAEKALSDGFWRVRYSDTSLLIWQQQQLEAAPPSNYLSRSQSSWYSRYGNQAVLVRDKRGTDDPEGRSRICSVM